MTNKKLIHIVICLLTLTGLSLHAQTFSNESVRYKVLYKWGIVQKTAGHATLSLTNHEKTYGLRLTASSASWADKFYKVRDTLIGEVNKQGFKPLLYEKMSHEGDEHKHDVVRYSYAGAKVTGTCTSKKWDNKGNMLRNQNNKLEAFGTTVDMLSSFYYMRSLPYASWKPGHVTTMNVYSGRRKELLTIRYVGIQKVKVDKKTYECYHIKFLFTSDGKTKTSDDMDAWLMTTGSHLPVKMVGKLKIGEIQCLLE